MRRPPLVVVLIAVIVIALGETGGAALSQLRPQTERFAGARIAARPAVHGLTGSAEYDDEVRARTVFAVEAGLSFFHTHAEGLAPVMLAAATLVASIVASRRIRAALYTLLTIGVLFPLGYLVYGAAVLELGRDDGVMFAERWVLTPLGSSALLGLIGLGVALATRRSPTS